MMETLSSANISTKLDRIATLAKDAPDMAFTTLAHHIDIDWLREAYRRTRKNGATGVDGQTATEYAVHLEDNLHRLLDRAKSGTYRAPPVRRVNIPKGDGSQTRPIGIPTFEDKILQHAVAMALGDRVDPIGRGGDRGGERARHVLEGERDWPEIVLKNPAPRPPARKLEHAPG